MILKDLLLKHSWGEVGSRLRELHYDPRDIDLFPEEKLTFKEKKKRIESTLKGFKLVFTILKQKRARKPKDKKAITICIKEVKEDHDGSILVRPWFDVHGTTGQKHIDSEQFTINYRHLKKSKNITDKHRYEAMKNELITYSFCFISWSEWLGMTVLEEDLKKFTEIDFICHCLWEMTFYGFSEREIRNKSRRLMRNSKAEELKEKDSFKKAKLRKD